MALKETLGTGIVDGSFADGANWVGGVAPVSGVDWFLIKASDRIAFNLSHTTPAGHTSGTEAGAALACTESDGAALVGAFENLGTFELNPMFQGHSGGLWSGNLPVWGTSNSANSAWNFETQAAIQILGFSSDTLPYELNLGTISTSKTVNLVGSGIGGSGVAPTFTGSIACGPFSTNTTYNGDLASSYVADGVQHYDQLGATSMDIGTVLQDKSVVCSGNVTGVVEFTRPDHTGRGGNVEYRHGRVFNTTIPKGGF